MECDRVEELLPWLLNGTLEAGERAQVLEHLRGCARCRQALQDTRMAWGIYAWHPPAEALVAYAGKTGADSDSPAAGADAARGAGAPLAAGARGQSDGVTAPALDIGGPLAPVLGEPETWSIEEHLAECPRCAAELELVRTSRLLAQDGEDGVPRVAILRPPAPPADRPAAASIPASGPPAVFSASRRQPTATPDGRAWRRAALAAGLVGLVALAGWLESVRHAHSLGERLAALEGGAASQTAQAAPQDSAAAHGATGASAGPGAEGTAADRLRRQAADAAARVAALERENGEARARLAALAEQSREMKQRLAQIGPTGHIGTTGGPAGRGGEPGGPGQRQAQLTAAASIPGIESDAWVNEVTSTEETTRSGEAAAPEAIPLSAGAATLLLKGRSSTPYTAYEVEVWDARDHRVIDATPVLRQPHAAGEELDEFGITLRRRALDPGSYVIHLFARTGAGRKQLATYRLRIS